MRAAADDETLLVGSGRGGAEDASLLLVRSPDVLEAPRRPQLLRHRRMFAGGLRAVPPERMPRSGSALALAAVAACLLATVAGASPNQTTRCLEENPTISGTPGNDVLTGTPGNDVIVGLQGDDTIDGGDGLDLICGGDGNDALAGGPGRVDIISGDLGNDRIDGSSGAVDVVSYVDSPSSVAVDLTTGLANGGFGADTLVNVNSVLGSGSADALKGNGSTNLLDGGPGNDTVLGGGGADLLGGWTGNDRLDGGSGRDVIDYSDSPRKVSVNLTRSRATGLGTDRLASVEDVIGSSYADSITGNAAPNALEGGKGADRLFGKGGRDHLDGGAGTDHADGGAGADVCRNAEKRISC
jgi:Ca2+-binding RTX toxin-like protein